MYQLREIVKFVRENSNPDGHGGYEGTNVEVLIEKIFADVFLEKVVRNFENFAVFTEKQVYKVVCREIDTRNIQPTDLILWNNKTLAINEIKIDRVHYFYRIFYCAEYEKDGRQII